MIRAMFLKLPAKSPWGRGSDYSPRAMTEMSHHRTEHCGNCSLRFFFFFNHAYFHSIIYLYFLELKKSPTKSLSNTDVLMVQRGAVPGTPPTGEAEIWGEVS